MEILALIGLGCIGGYIAAHWFSNNATQPDNLLRIERSMGFIPPDYKETMFREGFVGGFMLTAIVSACVMAWLGYISW